MCLAFNCLVEHGHAHIGYLDFTKDKHPHASVTVRWDAYLRECRRRRMPPYFFSEEFGDLQGVRSSEDLCALPTGVISYSIDLAEKFLSHVYRNRRINPNHFSIVSAAEGLHYSGVPL